MGCSSSIENEVKLSRLKILDSPKDNKTIASEVQTEVNPKSKNFNTELGKNINFTIFIEVT